MKHLFKLRLKQLANRVKTMGVKKQLVFLGFGLGILSLIGFFFIKLFGYIYYQEEFPPVFKLFLSEKILLMVFLTLFSMLVLSALISTLNIFFLSKDLRLLFASPLKVESITLWKGTEVAINSSTQVFLLSLPVLFAYCYYFASGFFDILGVVFFFFLYSLSGVLVGILLGLIIPAFFSVKRLQPVLSLVAILLISSIVVFLRMLKPEQFGNPETIKNLFDYMAGFKVEIFAYMPFSWIARSYHMIAAGEYGELWKIFGAFAGTIFILYCVTWWLQKKYYFRLFDKLNRGARGRTRSRWGNSRSPHGMAGLFKKEVKTFIRTPSQWSQLLIIAAIIVVFVLNLKSIPMPHPTFKNLISYLNLGMAAFIVAGLNSRFTFTTIPMENPGLLHLFASPFKREKIYKFKLLFYTVPQLIIGFILFFTADIALGLEPFARFSGTIFLLPLLPFLTVLSLYFSLNIKESAPLTPQHLLMTRSGIGYMLWSMVAVVASMIYFVRPLFLYYFSIYRNTAVPWTEILTWFGAYLLVLAGLSTFFYKRSLTLWHRREYL